MTDFNQANNRAVWFDIPVRDLERACVFYENVLAIGVARQSFEDFQMGVLDHDKGNGGCLYLNPGEISSTGGLLVYLNCEGRLADAVAKVREFGGEVVQDLHAIGPHGFRAVVLDSEGNRVALHSMSEG